VDGWQRRARPIAYGLLGLKPWEFRRYTVREFEDAVVGAHVRFEHAFDLVMRHALVTGQWAKRVTFRDLTGKDEPRPLDPRARAPLTEEDEERLARTRLWLAEGALIAEGRVHVEREPEPPRN
jgi:hypothetical protein